MPPQAYRFAAFFFAYYAYVGAFSPYASLYFADLGMSAGQVAVLMSLMSAMRIPGPNLWGWVADSSGKKAGVLKLASVLALVGMCGFFLGAGYAYFFAVMVVLNFSTSAHAPVIEALMLDEMRGDLTHYGRLRLWGSIGFLVSVLSVGGLLDHWGNGSLPAIAWIVLLGLLMVALGLREPSHTQATVNRVSVLGVVRQAEVLGFFFSTFMTVAAHASLFVFYSLFLEQAGHSKLFIGVMWGLGVIAEIVFFYFQSTLFRRFGTHTLMYAALVVAIIRFALIAGLGNSVAVLVIAQLMHALTFGAQQSAAVAVMQRWFSGPLQARGQALFISISYGMGATVGGLIFGAVWPWGGAQAVFGAACAMSVLALLGMAFSLMRRRQR